MLLFIPYNTDAPLYHRPIMTSLLIVVNIYTFLVFLINPPFAVESLYLEFGNGLHPSQWVSSLFIHADFVHLLGNIIFLWVFGLIIEGKLGWLRFGILYLSLGIFGCAVEQLWMLNGQGAALGASGAIYSLLAMSLIWAPRNKIQAWYHVSLHARLQYHFDTTVVEIPISLFCLSYIAIDACLLLLSDFQMSGAFSHILGALIGVLVSFVMLKRNWVDCEGWDMISLWKREGAGSYFSNGLNNGTDSTGNTSNQTEAEKQIAQKKLAKQQAKFDFLTNSLQQQIDSCQFKKAKKTYTNINRYFRNPKLPSKLLFEFSQLAEQQNKTDFAILLLNSVLKESTKQHDEVRIFLAELLVKSERPSRAVSTLQNITEQGLAFEWQSRLRNISQKSKRMEASGDFLEVDETDW